MARESMVSLQPIARRECIRPWRPSEAWSSHLTKGGKAMNVRTDTKSAGFSRRRFLANASALGVASLLGVPRPAVAEPPPEVRKIRLVHTPAICLSPQYRAEELLRLEGFSEIEYVD